jgi:hypothetical protein
VEYAGVGLCPVGNPLGGRYANPTYWIPDSASRPLNDVLNFVAHQVLL